jgi:hypothetical protein
LITGDRAVRAAHSLAADPLVDEVVVIGPAKSRSFAVVDDASQCDILIGSGPTAPGRARELGKPLIWDGDKPQEGVAVWGANVAGVAIAMSDRQSKVIKIAAAHPDYAPGTGESVRFAKPVGATQTEAVQFGERSVLQGKSYNEYAGCLVKAKARNVTIVDRADFLSGVALAAGIAAMNGESNPVWAASLKYLEAATGMGLVMAETT